MFTIPPSIKILATMLICLTIQPVFGEPLGQSKAPSKAQVNQLKAQTAQPTEMNAGAGAEAGTEAGAGAGASVEAGARVEAGSKKDPNQKVDSDSNDQSKIEEKIDLKKSLSGQAKLNEVTNDYAEKLVDQIKENEESSPVGWWLLILTVLGIAFFFRNKVKITIPSKSVEPAVSTSVAQKPSQEELREYWYARFEQVKKEKLPQFTAYYLLNLAKEADWSIDQQNILCERYGREYALPLVETNQILQGKRSTEALPYLFTWLEAQGSKTYPQLGLVDNFTPLFQKEGEQEAQRLFTQLNKELGC